MLGDCVMFGYASIRVLPSPFIHESGSDECRIGLSTWWDDGSGS